MEDLSPMIPQADKSPSNALEYDLSDPTEEEWLHALSVWLAEDFADEPDIYTWEDGKPFRLD